MNEIKIAGGVALVGRRLGAGGMALAILLAVGCGTVKRYRSVDNTLTEKPVVELENADESRLRVRMAISDTKISETDPPAAYKSLWDLHNGGQKALLGILAERYKDNDKFNSILNNKYLADKDDAGGTIDLTRKNVRIVFNISRWHPYELIKNGLDGFSPADRIEYLKYTLTLDSSTTLQFTNWNKYTTAYGSIDIADVSFSQSLSLSGGFGDSAVGQAAAGVGVSGSASESKTENQKVKYRYIQLNGSIGKKFIELESEGTREIDLSGNVIADVNMQFDAFPEILYTLAKAKDDSGNYLPSEKVVLNENIGLVPNEPAIHDIQATLTYDYAYRHVVSGDKTFYEWDDKVKYVTGTVSKKVTLLRAQDIIPGFCCLKFQDDPSRHNKNFIKVRNLSAGASAQETNLAFPDRQSANAFIGWLLSYKCPEKELHQPIQLKNGYALWYNGSFLTKQQLLDNKDPLMAVFEYDVAAQ